MNNRNKIISILVGILFVTIVVVIFVIDRAPTGTVTPPNEVINVGEILIPTNEASDAIETTDQVNSELVVIYTELFSMSWLQRNSLNMYEPVTLRAQGTPEFIEYFDNTIESLRPSTGTSTRFEIRPGSTQVGGDSDKVYGTVEGVLITEKNTSNNRQSVRVTIEFVPVEFDYQVNSVEVKNI